jgi:hypothetical protein
MAGVPLPFRETVNRGVVLVRFSSSALLVVLIGASLWAQGREPLWQGLQALLQQPWGFATMLDLYIGLLIFGAWIALTEPRRALIPLWWLLLLTFGNMATLAYLLRRSFIARDLHTVLVGEPRLSERVL